MNSNAVPTNRLKLVRCSLEDPQTRKIAARMGMSVAQFMTSLRYSQPHGADWSESDSPKCIVWPKHTDFEVRDPYASVYQYEPRDNSWSLRFRALGCYNVIPRLPTEENRTNTSLNASNNLNQSTNISDFGSKSDENSRCSAERERLHSLLKSRSSASSNLELPSETITQAERHKLLEDLRLTDSEDEDESNSKHCATNEAPYQQNPVSLDPVAEGQSKQTEKNTLEPEQNEVDRLQSSLGFTVPNITTISNAIDTLGDAFSQVVNPPPFISPLSVMGDDAPCRTPLLPDSRSAKSMPCPNGVETGNVNSNALGSRPDPRKSTPEEDFLSNARQPLDKPASNGPLVQKQLSTVNLTHATSQLEAQSKTCTIQNEHLDHDAQTRSPTMQSEFTPAARGPKSKLAPVQMREPSGPPFETVTKNSDYIRRLLMESEAFLAIEKNLRVTELSPQSTDSWKCHNHSMMPDKENVVTESAGDALTIASHLQSEHDKTRDAPTSLSAANNLTKQVLSIPAQLSPASSPEIQRTDEVSGTATVPNDTNPEKTTSEQIVPSKGTDEIMSSATAPTERSNSLLSKQDTTQPTSMKQSDRALTPDSNLNSAIKPKNPDQRKRNQKVPVERPEPKTELGGAKSPERERKRSKKNASRPLDRSPVTANDTASSASVVPGDEHPTDRTSMPPPISEGNSGKRVNSVNLRVSEFGQKVNDSVNASTDKMPQTESVAVTQSQHELSHSSSSLPSRVNENANETSTESEICATLPTTANAVSLSREIPNKRWVFSNVALKKVRSKLRSVIDESLPSKAEDGALPRDFLDKIRAALLSICSSRQQSSPNESDRNGRSRTLTGVLLVPPRAEHAKTHPMVASGPINRPSPVRHDTSTMTSPSLAKIFVETLDVAIQHALSPQTQSEDMLSASNDACQALNAAASPPKCSHCRVRLDQVTSGPISTNELRAISSEVAEYLLNEERDLRNSTVEIQLERADECKTSASRCWKKLVGAVSESQSGLRHSGAGRFHLLLSLNDLHLYPVYLIQGVRHYLAAAYLLHAQGDTTRAVELCAEATAQLEHIGRRLQRVEAKLMRHRVQNQQGTSDSSENTTTTTDRMVDLLAKAKRDASWIHLWYYVLARIRAMIRSHEYQLRLLLDASLLDEIENDPSLNFLSESSTGSSHTGGTVDSKVDSSKPSTARIGGPFSPSAKPSPSCEPVQLPNGSLEFGRFSPADKIPIRASTMERVQRLLKLNGLMRRAAHDWIESEKLASDVPHLPIDSSTRNAMLVRLASSSAPIPGPSIDFIIGHAAGGAIPTSQYTSVITLICFIDGVVKVHNALLEQLKLNRAADDGTAAVVSQEGPTKTVSARPRGSLGAQGDTGVELFSDHGVKGSSVQLVNECIPNPDEHAQKKSKKSKCARPVQLDGNVNRASSTATPPTKLEADRVNSQPRGKHKLSDVPDKVSKKGKRRRLLESDDPKLWDSSMSSTNSTDKVDADTFVPNKAGGYVPSHIEQTIPKKSMEKLDADSDEIQPSGKSFEKPRQLMKLDDVTRRKLSGSVSHSSSENCASVGAPVRSVVNQTAGRPVCGLPDTPNSQMDTASPDYTASTPSPPPMRPRSKSLAPTSSTRRPCDDRRSEDEALVCEVEPGGVKRKNLSHVDSGEKDWSDENTYQPKRVRASNFGKSYEATQSGMASPSPDSSPFPSYQPSIPDEVDKARRRRSASVGRSLSHKRKTETNLNDHSTTINAHGYDPMHADSRQRYHVNGEISDGRGSSFYSHLKTAYTSSKASTSGKSDIPSYYEGWLNQSQSQAQQNKGQNNKYHDLQKRYGKRHH